MKDLEFIIGNEKQLEKMQSLCAWRPFDERIVNFCDTLSNALMKNKKSLPYPDLITFAFWLRKNNLQRIKQQYSGLENSLGKGLIFHIAPGNIALSFAYSMITGLLTGNANIVKLATRQFEQTDILCEVLREVLSNEAEIAEKICLIKYPHDKTITDEISAKCHMRIIWGGDATINIIRQSPIPPRATEITFANRFSICLINADNYLANYNPKKTAHNFFIDTYLTDQNACSSPRMIFWTGEKISEAKEIFWNALAAEIKNYPMAAVTTVDKLVNFCKFAAENDCKFSLQNDWKIIKIQIPAVNPAILDNLGNSGYFYECDISDLKEILPVCTWQLQTLSYIGFDGEKLNEFILTNAPAGADRIVETGRTMDFGVIWDGHDVIKEMTRQISRY